LGGRDVVISDYAATSQFADDFQPGTPAPGGMIDENIFWVLQKLSDVPNIKNSGVG